jgi:transcriptional regulator with XRE-family HTH domain
MYQEQFIGAQVAAWRRRRGMSQRVLAGLAGISQPYLSQIETGSRPVERRSTLVALADALQVSVVELLGGPEVASDSAQARAAGSVPAIRAAIIMRRVGETRPSNGGSVDAAVAAITAADYVALGPMLPGLIGTATGPDLVRVGYAAMWYLNHMGYVDLACGMADLALAEAQRDGSAAWFGHRGVCACLFASPRRRPCSRPIWPAVLPTISSPPSPTRLSGRRTGCCTCGPR